jgi:xanthine dehydrogenase accessory factor
MPGCPDDLEVLARARDWVGAGSQVALITVLRTWGSSPRPPGSVLVINRSGGYVGSVSGGCVEEELVARYRNGDLAQAFPTRIEFGVTRDDAERSGLPCGGRLELLAEQLTEAGSIEALLARLQQGELVARTVDLPSGRVTLEKGRPGAELQIGDDRVRRTFGPAWHLLLIGNGQLARHLAVMALQLDYRVTICDPRDGFDPATPVAGVEYSKVMPDDAVAGMRNQPRTAIVTLAHDPRQDDLGLTAALESQAFYIGALGSVRSANARSERLRVLGYSAQQIARIHGPAGIAIGSKRPAEIAVSILAEITAIRNNVMASPAVESRQ